MCYSSKVVMFTCGGSASHKILFYSIGEGLAKKGHDVTFYAFFPPTQTIPGVKEVFLEDAYNELKDELLEPKLFSSEGPLPTYKIFTEYAPDFNKIFNTFINSKELRDLIKNGQGKYDIALIDGTPMVLPIASHVAKNIIYVMPGELLVSVAWAFWNPFPLSYVPNYSFVSFTDEMNFLQRWVNSLCGVSFLLFSEVMTWGLFDKLIKEKYPELSSVKEAEKNVSMVFVNMHVALDYPIPYIPAIKNVGGAHVRPPKTLPKELEAFVSGSGDAGFIYMSFGTIVPEVDMPIYAKEAFIKAFARIQQRVVWKYKLPLDGLSSNVMTLKYAPQQDLLGHKKAKAIITHGGQYSIMEAVYHGVPIIGIPVTFDQPSNIARATRMGICFPLSWNNMTADDVLKALDSVINDEMYVP